MNFKENDWVFCNFKLQQIKTIKDGRIRNVTDGDFIYGGFDLSNECFPVETKVKEISDFVNSLYNKLHAIKFNALNYPDIVRELESKWVDMCNNRDNTEVCNQLSNNLSVFVNTVLDEVNKVKQIEINGIKLIRR